jgi:hypothetical protein
VSAVTGDEHFDEAAAATYDESTAGEFAPVAIPGDDHGARGTRRLRGLVRLGSGAGTFAKTPIQVK